MTSKPEASKKKAKGESRFIGWQKTPLQTASFGRSTQGGAKNTKFKIKHSTGPVQEADSKWWLLDASQLPVGRIATIAATLLMGKHKASFSPGADSGDSVIVINSDQAFFSSNKADKKFYYHHSGWVGGLKVETAREALYKHSDKVIHDAVYGMLPKNSLSRKQLPRLKVFKIAEHGMEAQKPQKVDTTKGKKLLKNLSEVGSAA